MESKKIYKDEELTIDVRRKDKTPISEISNNRLALTVRRYNAAPPEWIRMQIDDEKAEPYNCSLGEAWRELALRIKENIIKRDLKEIPQVLAATHTIKLDVGQPVVVRNDKDKVNVKLIEKAGYIVPTNYPNAVARIEASVVVGAYMFSETAKKLDKRQPVDSKLCDKMDFPVADLSGVSFPAVARKDVIAATIRSGVKDRSIIEAMIDDMPRSKVGKIGLIYNDEKLCFKPVKTERNKDGKADCTYYLPIKRAKTLAEMYRVIKAWRDIRGSENNPRADDNVGYYYGLCGRPLYRTTYVLHDILALGATLKVNRLEIDKVDSIVNQHVLHSLVAAGWTIRVVSSSNYPQHKNEVKGIFSYHKFAGGYLRFVSLDEKQPVVAEGVIKQTEDMFGLVKKAFGRGKSNNCFTFTYAFLHPQMMDMEKDMPGYSLFPTSHAHNGQVIVVKAVSKVALDMAAYIRRVSMANTYKTFYVYTRSTFWEHDPFAHKQNIILRNRPEKLEFLEDGIVNEDFYDPNQNIIIYNVRDNLSVVELVVPDIVLKHKELAMEFKVAKSVDTKALVAAKFAAISDAIKAEDISDHSEEEGGKEIEYDRVDDDPDILEEESDVRSFLDKQE